MFKTTFAKYQYICIIILQCASCHSILSLPNKKQLPQSPLSIVNYRYYGLVAFIGWSGLSSIAFLQYVAAALILAHVIYVSSSCYKQYWEIRTIGNDDCKKLSGYDIELKALLDELNQQLQKENLQIKSHHKYVMRELKDKIELKNFCIKKTHEASAQYALEVQAYKAKADQVIIDMDCLKKDNGSYFKLIEKLNDMKRDHELEVDQLHEQSLKAYSRECILYAVQKSAIQIQLKKIKSESETLSALYARKACSMKVFESCSNSKNHQWRDRATNELLEIQGEQSNIRLQLETVQSQLNELSRSHELKLYSNKDAFSYAELCKSKYWDSRINQEILTQYSKTQELFHDIESKKRELYEEWSQSRYKFDEALNKINDEYNVKLATINSLAKASYNKVCDADAPAGSQTQHAPVLLGRSRLSNKKHIQSISAPIEYKASPRQLNVDIKTLNSNINKMRNLIMWRDQYKSYQIQYIKNHCIIIFTIIITSIIMLYVIFNANIIGFYLFEVWCIMFMLNKLNNYANKSLKNAQLKYEYILLTV